MGFAGNLAGTGYQPPERAGLTASDVPDLQLRWAFAFPGGTNMRTSPAVAGDAALVAGPFGEVLALDMATGCVRWSFEADAMIRGAIAVGEGPRVVRPPGSWTPAPTPMPWTWRAVRCCGSCGSGGTQ